MHFITTQGNTYAQDTLKESLIIVKRVFYIQSTTTNTLYICVLKAEEYLVTSHARGKTLDFITSAAFIQHLQV